MTPSPNKAAPTTSKGGRAKPPPKGQTTKGQPAKGRASAKGQPEAKGSSSKGQATKAQPTKGRSSAKGKPQQAQPRAKSSRSGASKPGSSSGGSSSGGSSSGGSSSKSSKSSTTDASAVEAETTGGRGRARIPMAAQGRALGTYFGLRKANPRDTDRKTDTEEQADEQADDEVGLDDDAAVENSYDEAYEDEYDDDEYDDVDDDRESKPAPTGWRALLAPTNPDQIPARDRERPWWGLGDVAMWGAISLLGLPILMSVIFVSLLTNMGYDVNWVTGNGARLGEASRQFVENVPVHLTKSVADIPLWLYQITSVLPLWIGFVAGPAYVAWRKGIGFVRDFKVTMKPIDIPVGLAVGLFSQLVMVAVVYRIIFVFVPEQDVSSRARDFTDRADSPWMIIVLLVSVGLITPIVEELFFRGLSHQAFKNRLGRWWGATATAAFFAITHGSYILIPPLFIFAFILSYLVDRYDRLGPAVFAHIGFNMVTAVGLVWNLGIG